MLDSPESSCVPNKARSMSQPIDFKNEEPSEKEMYVKSLF